MSHIVKAAAKQVTYDRRGFLASAMATVAAAGLGVAPPAVGAARLPVEGKLPSFGGATGWLNSAPLMAADLRGKVVLVSFWNFTCINWLRQRPYVRAWAETYQDSHFVVIGVHAPEFTFEKNIDDVRRDIKDARIGYPIAIDNDHAIWRAFDNQYWPALYFIDAQGRIRHHQFGEGEYERSEEVIRQLLTEAENGDGGRRQAGIEAQGDEIAADWASLKSPETYIGYARSENFASPGGMENDVARLYRTAALPLNGWGLTGVWTVGEEFATANDKSGRIAYRFHARDLHLVLAPGTSGRPVRFRITLDGAAPWCRPWRRCGLWRSGNRGSRPPLSADSPIRRHRRADPRDRISRTRCPRLRRHVWIRGD